MNRAGNFPEDDVGRVSGLDVFGMSGRDIAILRAVNQQDWNLAGGDRMGGGNIFEIDTVPEASK